MLWNGKGEREVRVTCELSDRIRTSEADFFARQPDRMGTCSAEPRQMFSPGCQLAPQDKVAHGAVAGFSNLFSLANHKPENRAYTGLSGEAVTLISCLLILNKTLD